MTLLSIEPPLAPLGLIEEAHTVYSWLQGEGVGEL
jgi:hypothetical protein